MRKFLLAAFALGAILYVGCKSQAEDPKSVLVQFFEALGKKDIAKAKTLATKDSESMISMIEMGMNMAKDKEEMPKFNANDMEFGEAKIDGDKATIPVKEKKSGETMNYTLKKESGKWKVAFDKSSMMEMGMEKMKEEGINPTDSIDKVRQELENINLDSIKGKIDEGGKMLDSAKKELDKLK
ncbi:MAG: DUF4878 domain-containing protein [Chitinophagaceae bacterium]|nr:DUF4878 domain-containing protein [Bacteroidota bacterium]MCC6256763.1 DUF4878 domain-containing protein [Chitinophagaceae bacterium]MCW5915800.1 DUF4878 domain-containing protein [Ferruginibacter sp.]